MVQKYNDVVSTDDENIKDFGKKVCDVFDEDLDKYPLVRLIGEGAYGKACVALQTSSHQNLVVLKFIKNKIIPREDLHALAKKWGNIRHRHIVQLLAHFHSSRGFCFVIEYAAKGNLSDLLKEEVLSTAHIQKIIVQLLQALNYLHTEGMFHGSLKPQNVLIFDGGTVIKICDFGHAQIIWKTFKDLQQTKGITWYMSPETRLFDIISRPADLWSAGIVSFQLLGGEMPTDSHGVSATVDLWHYRDFHGKKPLIQRLPESRQDLGKLVDSLLQKNPTNRDLEWPESLRSQIVSDASNDVEPMDQLLGTNAAGVGARDTTRPKGAQLQDSNENKSQKDFEYDNVMAILLSLESMLLSEADSFADTRMLNESFLALIKDFTIHINNISKPDYYKILVKYLYVVTEVLKKNWYTHRNYWMDILDFFRKAADGCAGEAGFVTIEHDYNTRYISLLSWIAQESPEGMLAYAKRTEVINTLLSWLTTTSKSFKVGILPLTCEASNAICSLLTVQSPDQLNVVREEYKQIVHAVTKAFLDEKDVRYAFYVRLRYGSLDTKTSVIQIILRCCMYEKSVGDFLCHLPGSSPVREVVSGDGGGDGTIVSLIFDLLSSYATDSETVQIGYPVDFISNLCLVLATIAQSLDSLGRTSVGFMLTSSEEVQDDRLSILDILAEISISLMPSVRLAVASIFFLERSRTSSFSKIAMPSIPKSETLRKDLGAVLAADGNERQFSTQQAFMDGTVGLLVARLKWGNEVAVRQFYYKDVPKILIDLMGANNQIGLSPVRVSWILSLLNHCREIYFITIFKLSFTKKYIKFMSGLISDVHLKHIKRWGGPGGGESGVRYIVDAVAGLLESPLAALKDACGGNGIKKGRIHGRLMPTYIESLVEEGIPGQVVKCLKDVKLEHATTPVAFLARMTHHRSATVQILDKGLFDPIEMRRLLNTSSPTKVKQNILKIVSDIATMDKVYYEHIEGADILPFLRKFLTDEDPKLRLHVCEAIRHMCWHSDYFYGLLEKHKIAPLLVNCYSDQDPVISISAGTAIAIAAIHNELLHKDLGRCIPQLAKFLFSEEEDHRTKKSACYLLRALVINSGKLCEDIIFEGAMEALIMLVGNCLLHPCNQPEDEEKSLLDISLKTLENLCEYLYCRDYFHFHYPVIEQACHEATTESNVAASVSHIFK